MRGMCARGRASQTRPTQEPSPQVARPSLWGEKVVMGSRYGRPSLLNHSRRLASCRAPRKLPCATTLSSLDAAVVTRRRRRVTSIALPSGGAPTGASLRTSTEVPLQRRRPRRRICGLRRLRPALPASSPMCAETCNWASDADGDDGGPGSGSARPGPTACGTGPSSHFMW